MAHPTKARAVPEGAGRRSKRRRRVPGTSPGTLAVEPHWPQPEIRVLAYGPESCEEVEVPGSAFMPTVPLRRLPLAVGDTAEVAVVTVDVETLAAVPATRRYTRVGARRWRRWRSEQAATDEFDVDEHGLIVEEPAHRRRR